METILTLMGWGSIAILAWFRHMRTASIALSNVLMPVLLDKGRCGGILQLIKDDRGVRKGVYLYNGILTNELIGSQFGIASQDINLLLSAF